MNPLPLLCNGGTCVVDGYKNATVYRELQYAPGDMQLRKINGGSQWVYNIVAKKEDKKLIAENKHQLKVPRGEGGMGQANICYADSEISIKFRQNFLYFMEWTT